MVKAKTFLASLVFLVIAASFAEANGVGNQIDKTVDGFSFDFGIEPKKPESGERAVMSLSVHNASTGEAIKTEDMWIRISKGNEILFTSSDFRIRASGPLFFGYTFKESGTYTIDFSLPHEGEDLRTSFTLDIKENYKTAISNTIFPVTAFIFGFGAALILNRARMRKKQHE